MGGSWWLVDHPCGSDSDDFFSASVGRRLRLFLSLDLDTMSYAHISWTLGSSPAIKPYFHPFQKLKLAVDMWCDSVQACDTGVPQSFLWFLTQFSFNCFLV